MDLPARSLLVGSEGTGLGRYPILGLAIAVFLVSFGAYALGIFAVSGGLVWIPGDAALLGMLAAAWVGYHRLGLVFGWLVTYASLLGYAAESAMFEISSRPFLDRVAAFLRPDGLIFLGVEALFLATVAFTVGYLGRRGVAAWLGRRSRTK